MSIVPQLNNPHKSEQSNTDNWFGLLPINPDEGRFYKSFYGKDRALVIVGPQTFVDKAYNLCVNYHTPPLRRDMGAEKSKPLHRIDTSSSSWYVAMSEPTMIQSLTIYFFTQLARTEGIYHTIFKNESYEWVDEANVVHTDVDSMVDDVILTNEQELMDKAISMAQTFYSVHVPTRSLDLGYGNNPDVGDFAWVGQSSR